VRTGTTQKKGGRFPEAVEQAAKRLLALPKAKYLSGSGRNALRLMSNNASANDTIPEERRAESLLRASTSARSEEKLNGESEDGNEIMVNDPSLDIFTFFADISTQSETAVAAFRNNVVAAYNDSAEFALGDSFMGYSLSTNRGRSFTDLGPIPNSPNGLNLGDPALVVDRAGNFYASFIDIDFLNPPGFEPTIGISKSTDGGATFGPPALVPVTSLTPFSFEDKEFLAVDATNSPFNNNIYVTFTNLNPDPNLGIPIFLSRSTDGGTSFSTPILVSASTDFCQGSEPVVGPNGEIYVAYMKFFPGPPVVLVAKSTNGGQSFGTPVTVAPLEPIGFGGGTLQGNFRVNSFPRIDVDPVNGHVYVVYSSNPTGPDGSDIFFTRSTNGGATWSNPVRVNDDNTTNDQFFPDIAVNGERLIEIIWYDRRGDDDNLDMAIFSARSRNGGRSFSHNRRVTSRSFPPAPAGFDPLVIETYMGDYLDIKGFGETFLLLWGDNRRRITTFGGTRNDQDVFFTRDKGDD
jgi:hypothetical protein